MGWSDGGTTALLLALKYPERVDKVIIWGAASYVTEADVQANNSKAIVKSLSVSYKIAYFYFVRVAEPSFVNKGENQFLTVDNTYPCCPTLICHFTPANCLMEYLKYKYIHHLEKEQVYS